MPNTNNTKGRENFNKLCLHLQEKRILLASICVNFRLWKTIFPLRSKATSLETSAERAFGQPPPVEKVAISWRSSEPASCKDEGLFSPFLQRMENCLFSKWSNWLFCVLQQTFFCKRFGLTSSSPLCRLLPLLVYHRYLTGVSKNIAAQHRDPDAKIKV